MAENVQKISRPRLVNFCVLLSIVSDRVSKGEKLPASEGTISCENLFFSKVSENFPVEKSLFLLTVNPSF